MTDWGRRPGRVALKEDSSPGRQEVKRHYTMGYRLSRRLPWRRLVPALVCAALALYGGIRLTGYAAWSVSARQTQAQLRELRLTAASAPPALLAASPEPSSAGPLPAAGQSAPASAPPALQEASPSPSPTRTPWYMAQYQRMGSSILPEFQTVYRQNSDLVGWIDIPGVLSQPVVYRDNSYYLTHDFYGKKSIGGAIFLDKDSPLKATTQNFLLHGHNMRDGSMFGRLVRYEKRDFWRGNCMAQLSTLYDTASYVIFAVMVVDTTDVNAPSYVNYAAHPTFRTEKEFAVYMEQVRQRSLHPWRVDVQPTDALLTLSTCLEDNHLVVMARRVREGESAAVLTAMLR